ncbi:phosphate ABC transporter permease subunit PstC [Thermodesulfobacterium sp.]|jgi:phosphate transport system permease protein|uniref:phosphate ABC transporter permease subunit PstC n=1 Tax=Thermodesulfobacterium sp. TaxID=1965289 RepID=UPI002580B81E|nr:phosphate ABC transporter permease subunit PstC [Thermodesulfobacterium sp.]MBZ4681245.1 pstC [Thermodesulfobacterium sp.]
MERRLSYLIEIFNKYFLGFWAVFTGLFFPFIIFLILLYESKLAIQNFGVINFLTSTEWDPVRESFGALPMIVGTLISTFIAILLAAPISIGIAIFITELAPSWLKGIFTTAIELLAAIPSIIYGMWGFLVFAKYMREDIEPALQKIFSPIPILSQLFSGNPTGIDVLTTSVVLSVMIIPFMSSVVKDAFNLVPSVMKESAYGLGATKWEVVKDVVIPYTASGIAGGLILSTGRALGETMAVTFLAGNVPQIPKSLLEPFTTITVALANQFTEADTPLYLSSLFYLSLFLFVISFGVLILAKLMMLRIEKRWKK